MKMLYIRHSLAWTGVAGYSLRGALNWMLLILSVGTAHAQTELILNGSFEEDATYWTLSGDFYANDDFSNCHSCPGYAYVSEANGSPGNNLVGTLQQEVTIPAGATSATLSFWYSISTDEVLMTPWDKLKINILDGPSTSTIGEFSNIDATSNYQSTTFPISSSYEGKTIGIQFLATTDFINPTVFRIDDVSVLANLTGTLPAPTLIAPGTPVENGQEYVCTTSVLFRWKPVTTATGYGFYLRDVTTGVLIERRDEDNPIPASETSFLKPGLIAGHKYRWNMQAFNGSADPPLSTKYYFDVVSPTALNIQPAGLFGMPIGGDVADQMDLLFDSTWPNGYPMIRFNANDEMENKWYVATAHNNNETLNGGAFSSSTETYTDNFGEAYHPGEDWNRMDGKDEGKNVYAINNGVVLFDDCVANYGHALIIAHRTSDGEIITSLYGHLKNTPTKKMVGTEVTKGEIIGNIGRTGKDCNDTYDPHLHFEIRRQSMICITGPPTNLQVSLRYPAAMWPPTGRSLEEEFQFIKDNYRDPHNFLLTPGSLSLIDMQPVDENVNAGQTGSFGVTATASSAAAKRRSDMTISGGSLSYQWRFNGADLPGETNATLTLPNAAPAQAGSYTVLVSDNAGSQLSDVATLTVNTASDLRVVDGMRLLEPPPYYLSGSATVDVTIQNVSSQNVTLDRIQVDGSFQDPYGTPPFIRNWPATTFAPPLVLSPGGTYRYTADNSSNVFPGLPTTATARVYVKFTGIPGLQEVTDAGSGSSSVLGFNVINPPIFYSVTTSASPAAGGTTTGDGSYEQGTSATVETTTNPGYTFASWTINGNVVSTLASYTFTVFGNRSLVAHFLENLVNVSPADGATGIATETTLVWSASNGADTYRLQVSDDPNDLASAAAKTQTLLIDQPNIPGTSYTVNLDENTQYFWRVKAVNAAGSSAWSDPWSFTTGAAPQPSGDIVRTHLKISATAGNFEGILDDEDYFGHAIANLGDLDGDGNTDVAVGAQRDDDGAPGTTFERGAVWILFLNANGTVKSEQKISSTEGGFNGSIDHQDLFGTSVSSLDDLDGDGVTDLAVGAEGDSDGGSGFGAGFGAVWILFLNADGTVKDYKKISATEGGFSGSIDYSRFGNAVANLGDLDGDAISDIAVGARWDNDGGGQRGAVWILFLNADGTVKDHKKISDTEGGFTGNLDNNDEFGSSVSSLGDLDGDGKTDLAVGAIRDGDGGFWHGAVWILFLNADGTVKDHKKISSIEGGFTGNLDIEDHFGSSLANLGDFDGDGNADLAVGAIKDGDGGGQRGAVWILFLNADGTVKDHKKISDTEGGFNGTLGSDYFGSSAASLGDLDGDGTTDLAVGAFRDDDGGTDQGAVWILFLNADGTGGDTAINVAIAAEWNLLGLPLEVVDAHYLSLFPNAIPGTLFGFDGTYFQPSPPNLDMGSGYWLRFPQAETVTIEGTEVTFYSITLDEDWNLMSGPSCSIPLSSIDDPGGIIIEGSVFGFNGTYYQASTLEPGYSFWVRASAAGQVTFSCGASKTLARELTPALDLDQFSALHISDASGTGQTLYFKVKPEEKSSAAQLHSFPPVPPPGVFDVRFDGGYRVIEASEAIIRVQASHYPLTIQATNLPVEAYHQYEIREVGGTDEHHTYALREGNRIEIVNTQVSSLKLSHAAKVPTDFFVDQNYPNPFNPTTTIRYGLPEAAEVRVAVYNVLGQRVAVLASEQQQAGYHQVVWDGSNAASGVYFYVVQASDKREVKKMLLIK